MTRPDWRPRPANRIVHDWRCTRSGVVVETVRRDATGRGHVVLMCSECEATDADAHGGGDAA
jgi:hypothetical protein